jgi:hypothetical protein
LLCGALAFGRFVLGIGMGAVWAPTYLVGLSPLPYAEQSAQVQHLWGGSAQASLDFWIVPLFGFRFQGGADLFADQVLLTYENETVLRVRRLGGTLFVGVAGRIFLRQGGQK